MHSIYKPGTAITAFAFIFICLFFSCNHRHKKKPSPSGVSDESFSDKLESLMKPVDTAGIKHIGPVNDAVRATYQADDYQPIWIKANYASNDFAAKLMAELEDLRWDGLNPERYHLADLKKLKIKLDTTKTNSLEDAIKFDTTLTRSYLAAAHDLLVGEVNPKTVDSLWYHVNDTTWNAPEALAEPKGVYPTLDAYRSKVPTYALLRAEYKRVTELTADTTFSTALASVQHLKTGDAATTKQASLLIHTELPWVETIPNDSIPEQKQLVMAYQRYAGIQQNGKIDSNTLAHLALPTDSLLNKIRLNMERVRWMQLEFGALYLVVDVPLMELFLRKDGVNVQHMRVVVGKPERQTPSLFATMANVVINPPWGVPPTILKNDVIPGIEKDGKKYLAKKGLKAYDNKGNEVNASQLNRHNYKNYTYKQDPGDDNALGYVKFNLPNPWDIYLHDTPHRGDFVKRFRALSSGCIRLQDPQGMAVYILSELEKKRYTPGRLDTVIGTHKTRWEVLKTKIPVHITYLTAYEDTTGKHIQFARDIYDRDQKLTSSITRLNQ